MRAPNFENGGSFGTAPLVTSTETKVVLPNLGKQLDCGIAGKGNNIERIIIQGNKIHHPRYTSNDWCQPSGDYFAYDVANSIAGFHPEGPKAVVLYQPGVDKPTKANHVIRYNNIYGDSSHRFNDILFESFGGGMKAIDCLFDTDVYGNYMADVVDDILEVERAVCNNRVFENYFTNVGGKAISYYQDVPLGGPFYQFRNVFDAAHNANRPGFWYSVQSPNTRANLMRRPFLPTGAHLVPEPTGRLYSYHNIYLATDDQGFLFFQGNDVPLTPGPFERSLVSRNNIYKSSALWPTTSGPGLPAVTAPIMTYNSGPSLPGVKTFDGDVYNGSVEAVAAGAFGSQCQQGVAIFEVGHGIGNSGKYQLALASPGHDRGLILPNFNDGYEGAAPDSGIQERGAPDLVFGVARFTPASGPPLQGFTPTADARVRSDLPTVNDGNSANLTVQKSATRQFESYLRFSVTGLSGRVIAAKLILKESPDGTSNSTNSALEVRSISGAWGEADVTWNNKPAYAAIALGSVPANSITQDQIVEILLDPSHFSGDGTYNLAMIGTSDGNDVPLFSREATTVANRPQLVLTTRPTAFNDWRNLHNLPQNGALDLGNPSGDGLPNLLKFALNLAPAAGDLLLQKAAALADPNGQTLAALTGLPAFNLDASARGVFTFIQRRAATLPGITYTVEWGDALDAMSINPLAAYSFLSLDSTWERVTVTDAYTTAQKLTRFARLRIISAP